MCMPVRRHRARADRRAAAMIALALAFAAMGATSAQESPPPIDPDGPRASSVQGTSRLVGQVSAGETVLQDGVLRTRGNILATLEEASDPRVTGSAIITLNVDAYRDESGLPIGLQVRYGTMRLINATGAWEGSFSGRLNEAGFSQTYWLEGEGAYEGLTYVVTAGGSGPIWVSSGLIYPGPPPRDIPPALLEQRLPVLPPVASNR